MKTTRPMTKSALDLARMALSVARESIPAYSAKFSPQDFTQHPHCVLMALRESLKTDYRGLEQFLKDGAALRQVLGLEKVPDHSTIQEAAERLLENGGPATSRGGRCATRGPAA